MSIVTVVSQHLGTWSSVQYARSGSICMFVCLFTSLLYVMVRSGYVMIASNLCAMCNMDDGSLIIFHNLSWLCLTGWENVYLEYLACP